MVFLATVILAIVSFAPGLIGSSNAPPRGNVEWITGRNEPLSRPAYTTSAPAPPPLGNYGVVNPTTYFQNYKTHTQHWNKEIIDLAPIVDSTTERPEPSIHTGFFLAVILPAFAFVVGIFGEARIKVDKVVRSYYREKRARIHLEHQLVQAEDEKAHMDQALRATEEQRKEAANEANDLGERLAQLAQKEFLLRKDLALSRENIKGLQATVAKKGKEALEYRAQAYRTTRETPPTQMSRLRFGTGQTVENPAPISPHHHHHAAHHHPVPPRDQRNHVRSTTESEVDDDDDGGGWNNVWAGGSGSGPEILEGKRPTDRNFSRFKPGW